MERGFVYVMAVSHNKDYSAADRYGDLVAIADDYVTFAEHADERLMSRLSRIVHQFNPARDYLLPTGSPILIGLVCGLMARRHGNIRMLKWDRVQARYDVMHIDFDKLENSANGSGEAELAAERH